MEATSLRYGPVMDQQLPPDPIIRSFERHLRAENPGRRLLPSRARAAPRPGASRSRTLTMANATSATSQPGRGRRVPVDQRRLPAAPLLEVLHSTARRQQPLRRCSASPP